MEEQQLEASGESQEEDEGGSLATNGIDSFSSGSYEVEIGLSFEGNLKGSYLPPTHEWAATKRDVRTC